MGFGVGVGCAFGGDGDGSALDWGVFASASFERFSGEARGPCGGFLTLCLTI